MAIDFAVIESVVDGHGAQRADVEALYASAVEEAEKHSARLDWWAPRTRGADYHPMPKLRGRTPR